MSAEETPNIPNMDKEWMLPLTVLKWVSLTKPL